MSTKIEFKWKRGELESIEVCKVENGFTARVRVTGNCYDYAFADFPDVLELISECFWWDIYMAAAAEPADDSKPVFPGTFVRFVDCDDGEGLGALFYELGLKRVHNESGLVAQIARLKEQGMLCSDELAPWFAVLAELRATAASAAGAAKS